MDINGAVVWKIHCFKNEYLEETLVKFKQLWNFQFTNSYKFLKSFLSLNMFTPWTPRVVPPPKRPRVVPPPIRAPSSRRTCRPPPMQIDQGEFRKSKRFLWFAIQEEHHKEEDHQQYHEWFAIPEEHHKEEDQQYELFATQEEHHNEEDQQYELFAIQEEHHKEEDQQQYYDWFAIPEEHHKEEDQQYESIAIQEEHHKEEDHQQYYEWFAIPEEHHKEEDQQYEWFAIPEEHHKEEDHQQYYEWFGVREEDHYKEEDQQEYESFVIREEHHKEEDQQEFEWIEVEDYHDGWVDPKASGMNLGYDQAVGQENVVEEKNQQRIKRTRRRNRRGPRRKSSSNCDSHKRNSRGPRRKSPSKCAKNRYAELEAGKHLSIDIAELRYSQASCKNQFQCGRRLSQLVRDLLDGKVGLSEPFLRLCVFDTIHPKTNQRILRCIDNRRLFVLKEFAKKSGKQHMMVNVQLHDLNTCSLKLVQRFKWNSDATEGEVIRLRSNDRNFQRQK